MGLFASRRGKHADSMIIREKPVVATVKSQPKYPALQAFW
jgi:hypothetical protein